MKIAFRPKLLDCLPGYNRAQFGKDLASGITVGVLALPLAMAFAIASGVSPTAGIWTAIVAGFLTAAGHWLSSGRLVCSASSARR